MVGCRGLEPLTPRKAVARPDGAELAIFAKKALTADRCFTIDGQGYWGNGVRTCLPSIPCDGAHSARP